MFTNDVESKIARAVSSAVEDHMGNGTEPNEAIAKVAMDQGLSLPMTERAVEIFNAAKTRVFLKSAEDRTASFPVADTRRTIQLAFGEDSNRKTAEFVPTSFSADFVPHTQKAAGLWNDIKGVAKDSWDGIKASAKSAVTPDKSTVPDKFKGMVPEPETPKVPEVKPSRTTNEVKLPKQKEGEFGDYGDEGPVDPGEFRLEMHRAIRTLKSAADEARMEATRHFDLCQDAFASVARAVLKTAQWEDTVIEFSQCYQNDSARWVVQKVAELTGRLVPENMESGYNETEVDREVLDGLTSAYINLKEASLFNGAERRASDMRAEVEAVFTQKVAGPPPGGGGGGGAPPKGPDKPKDSSKPAATSSYGETSLMKWMQNDVAGMNPHTRRQGSIRDAIDGVYADSAKWRFEKERGRAPGAMAKLSPEEEGENLVRQRIFLKMMQDEIISEADPADVARHYTTLSRIAPEVSLVPEAARSFLRNMVHSNGGIDMFSVEQAGKATGALQKATRPGEISANPAMKDIREKQMAGAR